MRTFIFSLLACFAFAFLPEDAKAADENNPQTQARIRHLEERLRCLVCQNQSLADSSAELAGDLRREVREQVAAGRSDRQIIDYLVQRYGDFVLYEPPFKAITALLWLGPFLLLAVAAAFLIIALRRRRSAAEEPDLDAEGKRLVERVLGPADESGEAR